MGRIVISFVLVQTFLWQIPSSHAQRSISQYLHLTGLPYTTAQVPPTITNQITPSHRILNPRTSPGLTSLPGLSLPSLLSSLPHVKPELPILEKPKPTSNIDARLLNNLAIALQLLALSNIISGPPKESTVEKANEIIPVQPQSIIPTQNNYIPTQNGYTPIQNNLIPTQNGYTPTQNSYSTSQNNVVSNQLSHKQPQSPCSTQNQFFSPLPEQGMPNANFVGGSGFEGPKMPQVLNPVRSTMTLMSPYEALTSSDSMPKFTSSNPRKNFQSPYAMMDKDFFPSPNDLF